MLPTLAYHQEQVVVVLYEAAFYVELTIAIEERCTEERCIEDRWEKQNPIHSCAVLSERVPLRRVRNRLPHDLGK